MMPYVWLVSREVAEDLEAALQPYIRDKYAVMSTRQNLRYRMQSNILLDGQLMTVEQIEEVASYLLFDAFRTQFRMNFYAKNAAPSEISKRVMLTSLIFRARGEEENRKQSLQELKQKMT